VSVQDKETNAVMADHLRPIQMTEETLTKREKRLKVLYQKEAEKAR
jgi:hypothetical protein